MFILIYNAFYDYINDVIEYIIVNVVGWKNYESILLRN